MKVPNYWNLLNRAKYIYVVYITVILNSIALKSGNFCSAPGLISVYISFRYQFFFYFFFFHGNGNSCFLRKYNCGLPNNYNPSTYTFLHLFQIYYYTHYIRAELLCSYYTFTYILNINIIIVDNTIYYLSYL